MIPLYEQKDYKQAMYYNKLPLQCKGCQNTFYLVKHEIQKALNPNNHAVRDFCSLHCYGKYKSKVKRIQCKCKECNKEFSRTLSQYKKAKNHFCSHRCKGVYHNKHKTHGTRRSKLELWLEEQLTQVYPNIKIHYNKVDMIGAELDIYIPSLKKAIEINGIFHYKPIFGEKKWKQTQANDKKKVLACEKLDIELMVIDVTKLSYFKPKKAKEYLDLICSFIELVDQ